MHIPIISLSIPIIAPQAPGPVPLRQARDHRGLISDLPLNLVTSFTFSQFREYIDLAPEVRNLIRSFYDCRYAACLGALDQLMTSFKLDMHLVSYTGAYLVKVEVYFSISMKDDPSPLCKQSKV